MKNSNKGKKIKKSNKNLTKGKILLNTRMDGYIYKTDTIIKPIYNDIINQSEKEIIKFIDN